MDSNILSKNFLNFAAFGGMGFNKGGHSVSAAGTTIPPTFSDLPTMQGNTMYASLAASGPRSPSSFGIAMDMTGEAAEAKLVDYRGRKVAGFEVDSETLICLPQAYDLFLKHLVGGLHTVYTKLKRLDISPRVCNVEQVRALRSLGAIQAGVNRCKLIACKDFDALYNDCTNASARPGRPPKRSPIPFGSPTSGAGGMTNSLAGSAKKPKLEQDKTNASSGGVGSNFFSPQMGQLFPFMPFIPQQMMLSQLMSANQNAILAKQISEMGSGGGGVPGSHSVETGLSNAGISHEIGHNGEIISEAINGGQADSEHLSSPSGAVNLSKHARSDLSSADQRALTNRLEESRGDGTGGQELGFTRDPNHSPFQINGLPPDDYYSDPDTSGDERELKQHKDPQFESPTEAEYQSSTESLLAHVRGLIDVVGITFRQQLEQAQKDKWELTKILDQEKSEKRQFQSKWKETLRLKTIYRNRWRKLQRSHLKLQTVLHDQLRSSQKIADPINNQQDPGDSVSGPEDNNVQLTATVQTVTTPATLYESSMALGPGIITAGATLSGAGATLPSSGNTCSVLNANLTASPPLSSHSTADLACTV